MTLCHNVSAFMGFQNHVVCEIESFPTATIHAQCSPPDLNRDQGKLWFPLKHRHKHLVSRLAHLQKPLSHVLYSLKIPAIGNLHLWKIIDASLMPVLLSNVFRLLAVEDLVGWSAAVHSAPCFRPQFAFSLCAFAHCNGTFQGAAWGWPDGCTYRWGPDMRSLMITKARINWPSKSEVALTLLKSKH